MMKTVLTYLAKFVASIVLVAVIAAVYALLTLDLNDYKQQIESEVTKATGRELELNGDVALSWSMVPTLEIDNARFSNAKWADNPDMASVGKLKIRLALWPLINQQVQVAKVELDQAVIYLQTDQDGQGNWLFSTATQDDKKQESSSSNLSLSSMH